MRSVEAAMRLIFGRVGAAASTRPLQIALISAGLLGVLGLGLLLLETEYDVVDLWVSQRGRIPSERRFYDNRFDSKSPQIGAFIIQGKPGFENVLQEEVLEEVVDLQQWIRGFEYWPDGDQSERAVTLENICFKALDREAHEPCFQYSVLDCFKEGKVFNVGGHRNSKYNAIYSPRRSFKDFDMHEEFTVEYIQQHCMQWTNVGTVQSMVIGGSEFSANSLNQTVVTTAKALRVVFGTKNPKSLASDGLTYSHHVPIESFASDSGELCPDSTMCDECVQSLGLATAAQAGCIPGPVQQPESCCTLMAVLRKSPCVEHLFRTKPDVKSLGNIVFGACSLPVVELNRRCPDVKTFKSSDRDQQIPSENSRSATSDICTCLSASEDSKCVSAVTEAVVGSPEYRPIFLQVQLGNASAIAEANRILREDFGCGHEDTRSLHDVCSCFIDNEDPKCKTGAVEVMMERPELSSTFASASTGDLEALGQLAEVLSKDYNCTNGSRKLLFYKPSSEIRDSKSIHLEALCECIKNPHSKACETAHTTDSADPHTGGILSMLQYEDAYGTSEHFQFYVNICASNVEKQREHSRSILQHPRAANNPGSENSKTDHNSAIGSSAETDHEVHQSYKVVSTTVHHGVETEDEASKLLHGWEIAWQNAVAEKTQEYKCIDVAWVASSTLFDTSKEAGQAQIRLLVIGYLLVLGYMMVFFCFESHGWKILLRTYPPGPLFALMGFFSILLGVLATFGIIGILSHLSAVKASAITLQVVPLLMVGLGINDFFVLAKCLETSIRASPQAESRILMEETLMSGGSSITLSSAANTAAFAMGALSPIPAVQWFSIHMMLGVNVAYAVSTTILPSILAWGTTRWQKGLGDPLVACLVAAKDVQDQYEDSSPDTPMTMAMKPTLASKEPQQTSKRTKSDKVFQIVVFSLCSGLLGVSIYGLLSMDQGLRASQAVPKDSAIYSYLVPSEDYFQTYPVNIVFKGHQDYSDAAVFEAARATELDFVVNGYKVEPTVTSWMEYFMQYVEGKMCASEICMDEIVWVWDGFSSGQTKLKNICSSLESTEACSDACQAHCPQGPIDSEYRCELSPDKSSCYCPWRPILKEELFYENPPEHDSEILSFWADFLANTTGGAVTQNLVYLEETAATGRNPFGQVSAARSMAFVNDVPSVEEKLRHLKQGRRIVDASSIDAYPFDYTVYAVGEQYDNLYERASIAVGLSIIIAAFIMAPFILNWRAAVIITACVLVAVTASAGLSHFIGLDLNYALYVSLVVCVGLTMEFCAHISRAFMLTPGDRWTRCTEAIKTMGVAAFNGGVTTILGLLPVAWIRFPYFQIYFFRQYTLIVVIGLFVSLGLLLALLSLFGPPAHDPAGQTNGHWEHSSPEMKSKRAYGK